MISTHHLSGLTYEVKTGGEGLHKIIADVKPESGGKDLGPDPHEILEAALGACTSITVQMYANHKQWNLTSCNATVKFIQEDGEAIVIERTLTLEGEIDETQRQRLLQIAEKCPIHRVLARGVTIRTALV